METKVSSVRSQTRSLSRTQDEDSRSAIVWELVSHSGTRTQASGSSPAWMVRPVAGITGLRASAPRESTRSPIETQVPGYESGAGSSVPKPWRVDQSAVSRPVPVRESVVEVLETKESF